MVRLHNLGFANERRILYYDEGAEQRGGRKENGKESRNKSLPLVSMYGSFKIAFDVECGHDIFLRSVNFGGCRIRSES